MEDRHAGGAAIATGSLCSYARARLVVCDGAGNRITDLRRAGAGASSGVACAVLSFGHRPPPAVSQLLSHRNRPTFRRHICLLREASSRKLGTSFGVEMKRTLLYACLVSLAAGCAQNPGPPKPPPPHVEYFEQIQAIWEQCEKNVALIPNVQVLYTKFPRLAKEPPTISMLMNNDQPTFAEKSV